MTQPGWEGALGLGRGHGWPRRDRGPPGATRRDRGRGGAGASRALGCLENNQVKV